ncbi:MAG TPA: hypothetical protein VES64_07130 [Allosphingosinicella sp.]|nr:hypothetical protein [Allosphingosinicella sp.]
METLPFPERHPKRRPMAGLHQLGAGAVIDSYAELIPALERLSQLP